MIEIVHRLEALYHFYQAAHRLAKGDDFPQFHDLFGKLYEPFDEEIDTLSELLLVTTEKDEEFESKNILKGALKYVPEFGDSMENVKSALEAEHDLIECIDKCKKSASSGLENYLLTISQAHTHNAYKLSRILE